MTVEKGRWNIDYCFINGTCLDSSDTLKFFIYISSNFFSFPSYMKEAKRHSMEFKFKDFFIFGKKNFGSLIILTIIWTFGEDIFYFATIATKRMDQQE